MTLLAGEKISKRFNDQIILEQASFTIVQGDRIGLVGKNGSGKTTLFEILVGRQDVDDGQVVKSRQCRIDYVEQEKGDYVHLSLFDYVASSRGDLLSFRHEIKMLEELLERNPDDRDALSRLGDLQSRYEHAGGFGFENEIKIILNGLGFSEDRFADRVRNFSGGEKNRAGLARVLAGIGNLILLDEPTNHLDIPSTEWLEEYLLKTDKSYVVVSHDRAFLGNTVSKVWEINGGRIDFYVGSFDRYVTERSERRRLQEHRFRLQQEEIERIEDFIQRNMAGQKTKQAQSKLKYLSRIKRIPPPKTDGSGPALELKLSGRSYAHVMAAQDLSVGYGDKAVVDNLRFDIYRGYKVGLVGANGSGKTTLLKTLVGELSPLSGEIRLGNNVDVAYFDQELSDLNADRTVLENLWELDPYAESNVIRSFLGRFGFSGDDVYKQVASLSGGEKTKLSLARLLYHPANFIIFDEPTNHLDMVSREALEEALISYDGSFLVVSHDRYFLDRVVNKIFYISNGCFSIFEGNYSYFREKTERAAGYVTVSPSQESKQHFMDFKEKSKLRARRKKDFQTTQLRISDLEKELEQLTLALSHGVPRSDWEQLETVSRKKKEVEDQLLSLYDRLEQLMGARDD